MVNFRFIQYRVSVIVLLYSLSFFCVKAQERAGSKPVGLLCDLMAYTDYQSINGYQVPSILSKDEFMRSESVKILNRAPYFSWSFDSKENNLNQTAYQVIVSDNLDSISLEKGNIWDSGIVKSYASSNTKFSGKDLKPETVYYWKVKAWLNGVEGVYSEVSTFFTNSVLYDYKTPKYPLQKIDEVPIKIITTNNNTFLDFGKAAFGQLKLTLVSNKMYDTVTVHLGEKLDNLGNIDRKPSGTIRYQKHKIPLRQGKHTYQIKINADKRNTGPAAIKMPEYIGEVLPFRYCEIEGYENKLELGNIVRVTVIYPFNDYAAEFHSSDSILNKIWDLCKYSIKATSFAGIYVDGDRERIPYEADAYINQLSHYAVDKEFSMGRNSHEYLIKNANWPTEWILQSVLMAYNDYLYTGDIRSARFYYNDLKAKLLIPLEDSNGLISTRRGKQNKELLKSIHYNGDQLRDIVDWPHTGILGLGKTEGGETDGFVFTDYNAVVNAYYFKALKGMEAIANDIGNFDDAKYFRKKVNNLERNYYKLFWDKNRKVYRDGIDTEHASLHSNMFALAFGLVKEEHQKDVMSFIRSRGMAASVYGSQFLMDAIYEAGDAEYALSLLTSKSERSWFNMISEGSTITMEAWGNKFKPNQDWNHAWGAAPANIISRKLMGIEPQDPGWSIFRIKPQLGSLQFASIKVPSIKGDITVRYENKENSFSMKVKIPVNTSANVILPADEHNKYDLFLDDKQIRYKRTNEGIILPVLNSGAYEIKLNRKP